MKKVLILMSFIALFVVFFSSCKKENMEPRLTSDALLKKPHKEKKDKKCKPGKTECPANPIAVGMAVLPGGHQVGGWVHEVTIYYSNPNPSEDTCGLTFSIGGKEYLIQIPLQTTDAGNLASFAGTFAVATEGFNAMVIGYHVHQRCDCDSSYYAAIYSPITAVTMNKSFHVSRKIGSKTYYSVSDELIEKMIGTTAAKK